MGLPGQQTEMRAFLLERGAMIKYRSDVEGLRAVAVGSILLYHFGVEALSGGYVGVDIFFVISGFLIGRSVIDQIIANNFSFFDFIERRARRLIPSLSVMLIACAILFAFIMLPSDLRNFGKSIAGTVIYSSNIIFFRESGYFDQDAIFKPLLHTWSLAVEEQFYLTIPLLMLALLRLSRTRVAALSWLSLIAILSFIAAQAMMYVDASASFYLLPFRAWELLAGVALGFLRPDWLAARARGWRELGAIVGALLIGVPILTYTHDTPFPGLAALPVVLGTALLIAVGATGSTFVGRFLALRPLTLIGLISYSLYLWHWPVVVALTYNSAGAPSPALLAAGVGITIVLSLLSWRYVEEPFRRRQYLPNSRMFFAVLAAVSLGLIGVGGIFYKTNGLPNRFSPAEQAIATAAGDFLQSGGVCVEADNPHIPGLAFCRLGDPAAAPSFLVWGDSHGRAFRDGIDLAARDAGRSGLLVWGGGCPPLVGIRKTESAGSPAQDRECYDQSQKLRAYLATDRQLRSVLLIGRWAYYTEGRGTGADSGNIIAIRSVDGKDMGARPLFADAMQRTVAELKGQGRKVFILEQAPEIPSFNARALAQRVLSHGEALPAVLANIGVVGQSLVDVRQQAAEQVFAGLERDGRATIIRTHALFCRARQCEAWLDGRPALFDNNHVTVHTSVAVRGIFAPMLADIPMDDRANP